MNGQKGQYCKWNKVDRISNNVWSHSGGAGKKDGVTDIVYRTRATGVSGKEYTQKHERLNKGISFKRDKNTLCQPITQD